MENIFIINIMQVVHKDAHTCEHQTFPFLGKSAFSLKGALETIIRSKVDEGLFTMN